MAGIAAVILLATAVGDAPADGVSVSVQAVSDNRSTEEFFKGLKVKLKIRGNALSKARGIMPLTIREARSDIGEDLLEADTAGGSPAFLRLRNLRGEEECVLDVNLRNPARRARSVSISGTATLYVPRDRENEKIVIKRYRDHCGKALDHPELRRRGIQLTFTVRDKAQQQPTARPSVQYARPDGSPTTSPLVPSAEGDTPVVVTPGGSTPSLAPVQVADAVDNRFGGAVQKMFRVGGAGHDLAVEIVDPKDQIYGVRLFNSAGERVVFNGWSYSSGAFRAIPVPRDRSAPAEAKAESSKRTVQFDVRGELPQDGYLELHLSTDDNLRKIPFSTTITLP